MILTKLAIGDTIRISEWGTMNICSMTTDKEYEIVLLDGVSKIPMFLDDLGSKRYVTTDRLEYFTVVKRKNTPKFVVIQYPTNPTQDEYEITLIVNREGHAKIEELSRQFANDYRKEKLYAKIDKAQEELDNARVELAKIEGELV